MKTGKVKLTRSQKKRPSKIAALLGLTEGKQKDIQEIQIIQTVQLVAKIFSMELLAI